METIAITGNPGRELKFDVYWLTSGGNDDNPGDISNFSITAGVGENNLEISIGGGDTGPYNWYGAWDVGSIDVRHPVPGYTVRMNNFVIKGDLGTASGAYFDQIDGRFDANDVIFPLVIDDFPVTDPVQPFTIQNLEAPMTVYGTLGQPTTIKGAVSSSIYVGESVEKSLLINRGVEDGNPTGDDIVIAGNVPGIIRVGRPEALADLEGDIHIGGNLTGRLEVHGEMTSTSSISIDGDVIDNGLEPPSASHIHSDT